MKCERCSHDGPDVKRILIYMKALGYPAPMLDATPALCMTCITHVRDTAEAMLDPATRPGKTEEVAP